MSTHFAHLQDALLGRRQLLAVGASALLLPATSAAQVPAQDEAGFASALRQGSCAVLIRHALTEPGIGDPPGFRLDDCSSQRQLSVQGRAQATRLGQWFAAQDLRPREVQSSQWCRCTLTAELAFGRYRAWTALNSTFRDADRQPAQTRALREALVRMPRGQFDIWVTHQVNMTALTGQYPSMGEAFVVDASARVLARMRWD